MDGTPPNINTTSTLQVLLPDFTDRAPLFSSWPGCTEGILKHLFISWFSCKPLALISSLCETPACLFLIFFAEQLQFLLAQRWLQRQKNPNAHAVFHLQRDVPACCQLKPILCRELGLSFLQKQAPSKSFLLAFFLSWRAACFRLVYSLYLFQNSQPNHRAKQWGHYKLHRRCYQCCPMIPSVFALNALFSWAIWEDSASQQNTDVTGLKGSASHNKDTSISLTIITLRNRIFSLFLVIEEIFGPDFQCISNPR